MFGISSRLFKTISLFLIVLTLPDGVAANDRIGNVRIAVTRYMGDAHNYIAHEKGLFKKNNLDVELVINQTGLESVRKLLRREVEFAMIIPTPIILSSFDPKFFLRGSEPDPEYAVIANLMQSTSLNSVVALTGKGIKAPKDLEGKSIALMLGTGSEYFWYVYSDFYGIDRNKVRVVDAKPNKIEGLLKSGAVDGFTLWEPITNTIRKRVGLSTLVLPEQKSYSNGRLVVVRRDFVSQHPDVAKRYLKAIYEAEDILQNDPVESARIMSNRIGSSVEDIRFMQNKMTFNISLDESLIFNFVNQAKWVRRTKYDTGRALPDYREILFDEPLAFVKPGSVNFVK